MDLLCFALGMCTAVSTFGGILNNGEYFVFYFRFYVFVSGVFWVVL